MEQCKIILMERIERSFSEHFRESGERERRVRRSVLMEVYLYLKGRVLSRRDVQALLRLRDPLMTALACWKHRQNRSRFLYHLHPLAARADSAAVVFRAVRLLLPFRRGAPRRHRGAVIEDILALSANPQTAETVV